MKDKPIGNFNYLYLNRNQIMNKGKLINQETMTRIGIVGMVI